MSSTIELRAAESGPSPNELRVNLYICGETPPSIRARQRVDAILDALGDCELTVVDVLLDPDKAERMRILATPLLVRVSPQPVRRIVGDLSDTAAVVAILRPIAST